MEEHDFHSQKCGLCRLQESWISECCGTGIFNLLKMKDGFSNQVLEFWFSCNPDRSMWWVAARCNLRHRRWRPSNKGGAAGETDLEYLGVFSSQLR